MKSLILLLFLIFSFNSVSGQRIVVGDKQYEGIDYTNNQKIFNSKFRSFYKVINGINYRELMYKVSDGWFEGVNQYYREEDDKVYRLYEGEERVILDFTLNVGDTIQISDDDANNYKFFPIRTVDTVIFNRTLRKLEMRVIPEGSQTVSTEKHVWIEGIGDPGFFFGTGNVFNNQDASPLFCVREISTFFSAGMGCPNILSSNKTEILEPDFHYDQFSKIVHVKNDRAERIDIYSIGGIKLKSKHFTKENREINLNDLDQQLCVIVLFDGDSYSSKILKI